MNDNNAKSYFNTIVNDFKIEDKSLKEWDRYLSVTFNGSAVSIMEIRGLLIDATKKLQDSTRLYILFKSARDKSKHDIEMAVNKYVSTSEKRVSSNKAQSVVSSHHEEQIIESNLLNIVVDFFEEQIKKIRTVLKSLEVLSNLTMVEMKNLNHSNVV